MKRKGLVNAVFQQAINTFACTECEAGRGETCEDINSIHESRLAAYIASIGGRKQMRRRCRAFVNVLRGRTS